MMPSNPINSQAQAPANRRYTRRLLSEIGANMVEYVVLASLIAVVVLAAVEAFRQSETAMFQNVASQFPP
ncbi:MAG: hypothetical protein K1X79_03470 [Oligoflexia bacterium]|nr:hypothetical protein [Oligoflexia bacterium]